ncbi:MAG: dipeptidase PepE [Planctomycetota bacterium]
MRLLLGSGGFRTEERLELLRGEMRAHFGDAKRLLFVPYALADHDLYVERLVEKGLDAGYVLDGIHKHANPVAAVREAEAISIGGGNTFRLVEALHRHGLIEPIRERVRAGVPFMGVSAGTNVACPTMQTTNDMPITDPPSFETLGLVPFQVNAHYYPGQIWIKANGGFEEHFGETRDDRIREYHEMNDRIVVALWESALLRVEDERVILQGANARIFKKGQEPVDVEPGEIGALLA